MIYSKTRSMRFDSWMVIWKGPSVTLLGGIQRLSKAKTSEIVDECSCLPRLSVKEELVPSDADGDMRYCILEDRLHTF